MKIDRITYKKKILNFFIYMYSGVNKIDCITYKKIIYMCCYLKNSKIFIVSHINLTHITYKVYC